MPDVADAAVVVAERAGEGKQLVAYYSGRRPSGADVLRDRLAASLPGYMVPAAFHWREKLPLTANGKIDRKALTAIAVKSAESGRSAPGERDGLAPRTPAERRLAAAWARVLGTPPDGIGRRDHFFDLGGNSLSAVKLATLLDRAVSVRDVIRNPVLADLATLVDGRRDARTKEE